MSGQFDLDAMAKLKRKEATQIWEHITTLVVRLASFPEASQLWWRTFPQWKAGTDSLPVPDFTLHLAINGTPAEQSWRPHDGYALDLPPYHAAIWFDAVPVALVDGLGKGFALPPGSPWLADPEMKPLQRILGTLLREAQALEEGSSQEALAQL